MKTKWSIVMALVLLAALAMPLSVAAGGEKVTLCHMPNTPDEVTITVSINALPAHLAHGDYQGECTHTEVLTCPFEEVVIPVIGPDMVKYTVEFPAPPSGYVWNQIVRSSNEEQDYLGFASPSGYPPPPPEEFFQLPGYQISQGSPQEPGVWDIYIMKVNPEDANFDHMVKCEAYLLP